MKSEINSHLIFGYPQKTLLSVVIPTYKNAMSLCKAVDSVVSQRCSIPFNLIVVDNEATKEVNDTELLLRNYQHLNLIVYYRNEKNLGMYGNWNRCFSLANSKYVLMLHADDYLLPGCLEEVCGLIEKNKIDALYLNRISAIYGEEIKNTNTNKKSKKRILFEFFFGKAQLVHPVFLRDYYFGFCLTAPTGFVMRKDLFTKGFVFKEDSHTWPGDLELALHLAKNHLLSFCEEPLVVKREGNGNDSTNKRITIPLIATHKALLFRELYNPRWGFFSKFFIYMRLLMIAKGFNISYEKDVLQVIPMKYYSPLCQCLYNAIRRIIYIEFLRR